MTGVQTCALPICLTALDPENPALHRLRAQIALKQKDDVTAADALAKAVAYESQDYGSRRHLVRIMMARSDFASAARYADEAIAIWPYERQMHVWAAEAFEKIGDAKRAELEKKVIPLTKAPPEPKQPQPQPK